MLTGVAVAVTYCPSGWVVNPLTSNSCYRFYPNAGVTWTEAQALCAKIEGHLATLEKVQDIVWMRGYRSYHRALQNHQMWIGGVKKNGTWVWQTRNGDKPISAAADWAMGEPNNSGLKENCLQLFPQRQIQPEKSHRFNDKMCTHKIGYVCQM